MKDLIIVIVGLILLGVVLTTWTVFNASRAPETEEVFCTADAKQCEDGSYVGRVAPDCAFAPCPDTNNGVAP